MIISGDILNCYLPKKSGSLKRFIMNVQASLFSEKYGVKLNHTAMIEIVADQVIIWEATVNGGVKPKRLDHYDEDALFTITRPANPSRALERMKSQAGIKYDFRSWWTYLRYLITGKWNGKTDLNSYSEKWYCSELVDWAAELTKTPFSSTPNHVFEATKDAIVWSGSQNDLLIYFNKNGNNRH